jgi:hypothetical protein
MVSKKRQICCLLFAFTLSCSATVSLAEGVPSTGGFSRMVEFVLYGTPPPARVKQWFSLSVMAPWPPGGPKFYFIKVAARKSFFDGHTYDVQVVPMQYPALLRAAQSFGCDHKMEPPSLINQCRKFRLFECRFTIAERRVMYVRFLTEMHVHI